MTRLEARKARHSRSLAWAQIHGQRAMYRAEIPLDATARGTAKSGRPGTGKLIRRQYPASETCIGREAADLKAEKTAEEVIRAGHNAAIWMANEREANAQRRHRAAN